MANVRKGKGYHWSDTHETDHGLRTVSGFTVDNLNSKTITQAQNVYEKVFIYIRDVLEQNESYCMDVEEERLQICQVVADRLYSGAILRESDK